MIQVFHVAKQVQTLCESQEWKFCFIGGIALQRWGEPRVTKDVDVCVLAGFGHEESYIQMFLQHFEARIDNAAVFALRNRVLLLKSEKNIGIDVALGGLNFEEFVINRASLHEFLPDITLRTCSGEDLIIYNAHFACCGKPRIFS